MHRNKKIILTSHCVLNQNAVIRGWERAEGAFNNIIKILLDHNISILQLPCPEFTYLGEKRPPMTRKKYDIEEYHEHCRKLATPFVTQIREYIENDYEMIGIIGIEGSPSCDILKERGIFMEEFIELLQGENININAYEVSKSYIEDRADKALDDFRGFINKAY